MWVANCTVCLVSLNDMKLWITDSTIHFHAPGDHSRFYEVIQYRSPKINMKAIGFDAVKDFNPDVIYSSVKVVLSLVRC